MSTTLLDERGYQRLLGKALPVVIRTDAEHRRMLETAAAIMEKPEEKISTEEGRLPEMLSLLIEEYETQRYPLPKTEPHKMLAHLLSERGRKPSDLWEVLPKSRVSEILSGKRSISKAQAIRLAEAFRVPVELFL